MNATKCVFLMLAIIFILGCEQNPKSTNEDFPEYFNKDLQETYLNDLKYSNIQQYKDGSISCTVTLTKKYYVEVLFKNELEIPVPIGKSLLLIDTLSGKKNSFMWTPFRIFQDGQTVRYIGKIANVRNLESGNYVIIPPKEIYTANIDLEKFYDLSNSGHYTLKYKAYDNVLKSELMKIESNTITFEK